MKRADYIRRKKLFGNMGKNSTFMPRKLPLYSELIRIGNNVHIASNVAFITHDIIHKMLNNKLVSEGGSALFKERKGFVEIMDNVFVGAGSSILYNVKIGSNVIIAAGSIVTHNIPANSVVAGIPAKVIERFDHFLEKRLNEQLKDNKK